MRQVSGQDQLLRTFVGVRRWESATQTRAVSGGLSGAVERKTTGSAVVFPSAAGVGAWTHGWG